MRSQTTTGWWKIATQNSTVTRSASLLSGRTLTTGQSSRASRTTAASVHWGYVLKGSWTVRQGDREETFETGDAFYMPPGHVPLGNEPGSQVLMFSPTQELRKTEEVIIKNVRAMQAG